MNSTWLIIADNSKARFFSMESRTGPIEETKSIVHTEAPLHEQSMTSDLPGRARGELNVGQLARQAYGDKAYNIGFGTDHGTVAAASEWGGPMEVKQVQPSHIDSYEHVCHEVATDNFLLPLRQPLKEITRKKLLVERLERAIGVIYRPETELQSHYFYASLANQFDEYIWFDETRAVDPLSKETMKGMPDTFPFGL